MKIVIAPDSFKESLSADKCCQAIKAGFSTVFPDARYVCLPIADGGEGTVDAMVAATGGKRVSVDVSGPMGEKVNGFYGLTGDGKTAIIEMAAASGLMLVAPEARNPLRASSFGTGELIRHALDAQGTPLGAGGGNLSRLASIDLQGRDPRISECRIEVACDVDNPLVGPRGAAAVFGPQKGATPEMVETLENGLRNYARILHALTGRDMSQIPGGGAAGGMGIAAIVFLEAEMKPGIEIVMQAVKLEEAVKEASLVITGEGRIDSQTAGGKAPIGVASVAKRHHVPVIGIAGVLGDGVEVVHRHGIDAVFSILPRLAPLPEVLANGEQNLYHSACNIARVIKLGQDIGTR
ncbi:TPA: glycerate kinase [Salmonella enterica]|uniref:Glycerate kinase n=1 Tax=Salmonella enterica I TaxID=59201 RepID=A0A612GB79_SALET|nr:glycerate kinase [Salmonella enterica subsp. enterica]HED0163294.1 glycerate kinase [Salmonella enterica subsp. enterica serovar Mississippi]ECW0079243.1 glycerate kinase [Salmonella enterica subsp. enterica]ECW0827039.1 glycerate kinase [Salmonella enterica subsp. enterica]ECW0856151.1 glycerate kinase [Salmonella enterica subsp. enterica]